MDDLAFTHGGNIYDAKGKCGGKVIDFSANINPLGLPKEVRKTLRKNLDRILHYPDPETEELTRKIAKYWGIKSENILPGNGSVDLIYVLMSAYKPETVLIPAPTFSEYERAARSVGSKVCFLKLKEKENFGLDLSQTAGADVLFLCNPNNPTGNLLHPHLSPPLCPPLPSTARGEGEEKKLSIGGGRLRRGGMVIIDEAFMDFLPDEKNHTLIWKAVGNRNIVVLRTFTKFFALPGLRIGYLVAHKDVIQILKECQVPWSVNALAQVAAEAILNDKRYIKETRALIEKEREFLFNEICKIKELHPYPSVTNFLLIKIKNRNLNSSLLTKRLIQKSILIRDCSNFRDLNNKFIRIAVRSHKENIKLIDVLKEII